ncbi:MAG: hypothetical protein SGILL_003106, partial [Bacillariaceae sp.]
DNTIAQHASVIDMVDLRTTPEDFWDDGGNATEPVWMPHCHVVGMLPFTPLDNVSLASLSTYEEAAAMALALEHLNTGNSSIVEDLVYLPDTCQGMAFTLEFLDTHYTPGPAIDDVFEFSARSGKPGEGLRPCAFVGASRSAVTLPTSLLTGHRGYVQVSATSTSFQLDEIDQYPLFGRTVPSDLYNVLPMLEYFQDNLKVTHLAVLTLNEAFGQSFGQSIQLATSLMASQGRLIGEDGQPIAGSQSSNNILRIHRINVDSTSPAGIRRALHNLKDSKYRYVLAAILTKELQENLLLQAVDMDLAGNGEHQWFFPDSFELIDNEIFDDADEKQAKLIRAYQGVGVFVPSARSSIGNSRYEEFQAQMSQIKNPTDISYLNNILPHYEAATKAAVGEDNGEEEADDRPVEGEQVNDDDPQVATARGKFDTVNSGDGEDSIRNPLTGGIGGGVSGGGKPPQSRPSLGGFGDRFKETFLRNFPYLHEDHFLNPVQHDSAAFMYDATILMGLSACQAIAQKNYGEPFSGSEQYEYLKKTSFFGVTGEVLMDVETCSRSFNSTTYELVNLLAEKLHFENGTVRTNFKIVTTDVFHSHAGVWESHEGFVFNDGTTTIPSSLPPPDGDRNYISTGVRAISWIFAFISIFLAIGFATWTYRNRESRVVRASQPFFLYLICSGVILVACATIPSSFDSQFAPIRACSRACIASIWLLFLGASLVFSSLFTKAYRINLIMNNAQKFRRVTITIAQTIRPMAALLLANVIILTLMTALNPPQYRINTIETSNDAFGRPRESYGACAYQEQGWFFLALAILNGGILVLSVLQSWHARGLATEFSESKYVFLALASTTVVIFIGAPVLVLARDTPNATLFLGSSINFVCKYQRFALLLLSLGEKVTSSLVGIVFLPVCMNVLLLMFVPKIMFRQEKKAAGQRVKISGLRQSIFGRNKEGKANTPLTEDHDDLSTLLRISGVDGTSEETDGTGERILTTKSARQLAMLVARLQRKLVTKEEELQLLKKQIADDPAEAPREPSLPIDTVHEVSSEDNEARDEPQDADKIQRLLTHMQGELTCPDRTRNDCASPSLISPCDVPHHSPVVDNLADNHQIHHETSPKSFDEENPAPLPVLDLHPESNPHLNKRVSDISQLTNPEEPSLRPEALSTFHVPSGLALSASDATTSATDSLLLHKSSEELRLTSKGSAIRKESRHDDTGSSSQFSSASADDLQAEESPPAIFTSKTF